METDAIIERCLTVYRAANSRERHDDRTCWVMNRPSYDRLRATAVTEDQERARADAHIGVQIHIAPPYKCRACGSGPFATAADLCSHVAAMTDPAYREPDGRDFLFGIRIEVRAISREPYLETPQT